MAPSMPPGPLPPPPDAAPPGGATAPPRRTHRWGIGAYVVVEAVFVGVSLLIGFAFLGKPVSVTALTVALAVPTVLAAGVAMLITRLRGNGPRTDLGLIWSWHDVRVGIAYGVGGLVITIPASLLYVVLVGPEQASSAVGDVFEGLRAGPVAALTVVLVVVVLAPLCEEIVYRGLLWGGAGALRAAPLGALRGDDPAVRGGPLRVHPHAAAVHRRAAHRPGPPAHRPAGRQRRGPPGRTTCCRAWCSRWRWWACSLPELRLRAADRGPSGTMVDRPRGWPSTVPRPPRRRGPRGP